MVNYKIMALFTFIGIAFVLYYQQQLGLSGVYYLNGLSGEVSGSSTLFRSFLSNSNSSIGMDSSIYYNSTASLIYNPSYIESYSYLNAHYLNVTGTPQQLVPYSLLNNLTIAVVGSIGGGNPLETAAYVSTTKAPRILSYSELLPLYVLTMLNVIDPLAMSMPSTAMKLTSLSVGNYSLGYKDPLFRYSTIAYFYGLGIPAFQNSSITLNPRTARTASIIPFDATDALSVYEIELSKYYIQSQSKILSSLYSCGLFNQPSQPNTNLNSQFYGIAIAAVGGPFSNITTEYTVSGFTGYQPGISSQSSGWLAQAAFADPARLNYIQNGTADCTQPAAPGQNLSIQKLFYLLSFSQYESGMLQQLLYDKSPSLTIPLEWYSDNSIMFEIGNLNLNSTSRIIVNVDNSTLNYSRYYNFIIARVHLNPGFHSVSLIIGNQTLASTIFVQPYIPVYISRSNDSFTITLQNETFSNVNITDLSISDSSGHILTYPQFFLNKKETIYLQALQNCSVGEREQYTIDFNTQYGKEHIVSTIQCT